MDLSPQMTDALQEQLNVERLNSAYYRAMSLALENVNWTGTAKFFQAQALDEQTHSDKIASYLIDKNIQPIYEPLDAPVIPVPELLPMFQAALVREKLTTGKINALYWQADNDQDAGSLIFLEWFVTEQVSSEREYNDILKEVSRAQGNTAALLILDREYGGD
jgi:ferritin